MVSRLENFIFSSNNNRLGWGGNHNEISYLTMVHDNRPPAESLRQSIFDMLQIQYFLNNVEYFKSVKSITCKNNRQ